MDWYLKKNLIFLSHSISGGQTRLIIDKALFRQNLDTLHELDLKICMLSNS